MSTVKLAKGVRGLIFASEGRPVSGKGPHPEQIPCYG
jgi:hypothetical protein